jgi:hypothetical protein
MESCNDQLVAIATSMNQNLTDLLAIMQVGAQSENQFWIRDPDPD